MSGRRSGAPPSTASGGSRGRAFHIPLPPDRRVERARVRKYGACEKCRQSKTKCTHTPVHQHYTQQDRSHGSSSISGNLEHDRLSIRPPPVPIPRNNSHAPRPSIEFDNSHGLIRSLLQRAVPSDLHDTGPQEPWLGSNTDDSIMFTNEHPRTPLTRASSYSGFTYLSPSPLDTQSPQNLPVPDNRFYGSGVAASMYTPSCSSADNVHSPIPATDTLHQAQYLHAGVYTPRTRGISISSSRNHKSQELGEDSMSTCHPSVLNPSTGSSQLNQDWLGIKLPDNSLDTTLNYPPDIELPNQDAMLGTSRDALFSACDAFSTSVDISKELGSTPYQGNTQTDTWAKVYEDNSSFWTPTGHFDTRNHEGLVVQPSYTQRGITQPTAFSRASHFGGPCVPEMGTDQKQNQLHTSQIPMQSTFGTTDARSSNRNKFPTSVRSLQDVQDTSWVMTNDNIFREDDMFFDMRPFVHQNKSASQPQFCLNPPLMDSNVSYIQSSQSFPVPLQATLQQNLEAVPRITQNASLSSAWMSPSQQNRLRPSVYQSQHVSQLSFPSDQRYSGVIPPVSDAPNRNLQNQKPGLLQSVCADDQADFEQLLYQISDNRGG